MDWGAFWSGLLGTTIPAFLVSLLMLYLSNRMNRTIELYKSSIEIDLSNHKLWHEKRIDSLLVIHEAFRKFTNWLHKVLYVSPPKELDVTPIHDFFSTIEEQLVYLDDNLRDTIIKYQVELLQFWNLSIKLRVDGNPERWKEIQKCLDFEIPKYLEKLRKDINAYADPNYPNDMLKNKRS